MKDASDTKTLDLIPTPKKRGRPSTGNAKTAAQRMREMRQRDMLKDISQMTLTSLFDMLRFAVKNGSDHTARHWADEIVSRARAVRLSRENAHVEPTHVEPANFLYVATLFDRQNQWYFEVQIDAANLNQARLLAKRDHGSKTVKVFRVVKL